MLTDQLIQQLGLLKLVPKGTQDSIQSKQQAPETVTSTPTKPAVPEADSVHFDKNEFRLLVKMLQAINHDCQYDLLKHEAGKVTYHYPNKTLVFDDINAPDSEQVMNLCSLTDLLHNPALKRPVWEKLKTLIN